MTLDRRNFIKATATTGAALLMGTKTSEATPNIIIPAGMTIKIMATNWGFDGTLDHFCSKAKAAGYDGIEIVLPGDEKGRSEMSEALKKYSLEVAFLVGSGETDPVIHLQSFEKNLSAAILFKPIYINCHAGRDHFSYEQNKSFIDHTTRVSKETKIPIYHETHRSRIMYSAPVTKTFLDKIPELSLTLDISHWCAVHESLLSDQPINIDAALKRTGHIHARVGHPEGPQVNDPRAPEWTQAVEAHLMWWDKVVSNRIAAGASTLTFLTEFGPVDYMPAMPYTRQPLANQWDINVYMLQLLRKRYGK